MFVTSLVYLILYFWSKHTQPMVLSCCLLISLSHYALSLLHNNIVSLVLFCVGFSLLWLIHEKMKLLFHSLFSATINLHFKWHYTVDITPFLRFLFLCCWLSHSKNYDLLIKWNEGGIVQLSVLFVGFSPNWVLHEPNSVHEPSSSTWIMITMSFHEGRSPMSLWFCSVNSYLLKSMVFALLMRILLLTKSKLNSLPPPPSCSLQVINSLEFCSH